MTILKYKLNNRIWWDKWVGGKCSLLNEINNWKGENYVVRSLYTYKGRIRILQLVHAQIVQATYNTNTIRINIIN